ncbi:hypothetical protein CHISP_3632 [Chitinispirillum alkaliphilum]|nr:hypothetical protein CHISP_3632 [Chitinispirillum alkaliphilum]
MEYTIGTMGRCIVMRLHENDPVYKCIEETTEKEKLLHGVVLIIGGVKNGGVVVGPKDQDARPLSPVVESFSEAREIAGVGTIFPNSEGSPKLHLHATFGKGKTPITGCPRKGLDCWLINEVVILELKGVNASRIKDKSGMELLKIFT